MLTSPLNQDENAPIDHPEGPASVSAFGPDRIRVYRRFQSSRESLFDAYFGTDTIARWLGGTSPVTECDIALQPGGRGRFSWSEKTGPCTLTTTFQEVARPARVVLQQSYEGVPEESEALSTLLLIPSPEGTLFTQEFWYKGSAARDAALPRIEATIEARLSRLEALLDA